MFEVVLLYVPKLSTTNFFRLFSIDKSEKESNLLRGRKTQTFSYILWYLLFSFDIKKAEATKNFCFDHSLRLFIVLFWHVYCLATLLSLYSHITSILYVFKVPKDNDKHHAVIETKITKIVLPTLFKNKFVFRRYWKQC